LGTKVLVITFFFLYFPSFPLGKSAIASTKKKKMERKETKNQQQQQQKTRKKE